MNAPEIARPGLQWFNVAAPLQIESLRGRVVILDFWTEGCINCIQIIPTLRRIEEKFPDKVVVIGVHSPKFANEKNAASVKDAIRRYDIRHPIIHDPEMTIWRAYNVQAWPTLIVIDADGSIAGSVPGEPDPDRMTTAIANLIAASEKTGALKPAALDLTPLPEPKGRFLYPGKLKSVPSAEKRWVLADGGHNQIVLLDDAGKELARYGSGESGLLDGSKEQARFNHPQGVIASHDAIFVADGGDFVATASYVLRPRGARRWLDPGVFGTLGVGAGFALAAALERPDAETWILFGDGALGWSLAEFDTFVRHQVPVIAVVGNDAGWTQIAREQVKMLGDDVGVTLARTAYHEAAAAFGAEGILVRSGAEIADGLARARAAARAGRPALVNVWLDRSDFRDGSISM